MERGVWFVLGRVCTNRLTAQAGGTERGRGGCSSRNGGAPVMVSVGVGLPVPVPLPLMVRLGVGVFEVVAETVAVQLPVMVPEGRHLGSEIGL